jgi:hypothetical protein
MKKLLFSISVLGSVFFSSCEKNELLIPEDQLIKSDKAILCRGCGDWDIILPESQSPEFRGVNADTIHAISKPIVPSSNKK